MSHAALSSWVIQCRGTQRIGIVSNLLLSTTVYRVLINCRFGITAGEYAIYLGHSEVLRVLLQAGSDDMLGRMKASSFPGAIRPRRGFYLNGPASYGQDGCLLDVTGMPVMMPWESQLMVEHAKRLIGPRVMNIGFGIGCVDGNIQEYLKPTSHTIVEPHPTVLARIEHEGWTAKPGVVLAAGTWQTILPTLEPAFDSIFYDTHDEGIEDFLDVARAASKLLRGPKNSVFSFWNGKS